MSFAAPLMLLGLAAVLAPLVIHLVGRRRAPRLRFAAIDFVLRTDRRIARQLKARKILLLAVRMLLVGLIAVAMAKPFAETASELPAVSTRPQGAVLVLDDTLSMRRRVGDARLFARARQRARQLVDLLGSGRAELAVLLGALDAGGSGRLPGCPGRVVCHRNAPVSPGPRPRRPGVPGPR